MRLTPEAKRKIQWALIAGLAIAAVRTGHILYERHLTKLEEARKHSTALNPDYYVTPKKLHAYDLGSAKQLTQQPVWVKEGYRFTYYPYDRSRKRADFAHEGGTLLPIQRLEIKDVVTDVTPGSPDQRQMMAVFEQQGKTYAFPIAVGKGQDFQIYADEMLYIQDPHELYKHWSADVWQAIDQHQIREGMNEIQAVFALGMGVPERSNDPAVKTVNYPNGGKPITVTFRDGKAADIKNGPSA
jgi:hypothetical protein